MLKCAAQALRLPAVDGAETLSGIAMRRFAIALPTLLTCALLLTGCERLGIEDPAKVAAVREAESRAVGAACRHAGRAIEDCYALNGKAQKAAVFAGWKEMNDYMRENKIDAVVPQLAATTPRGGKPAEDGAEPPTAADKGKGRSATAADASDPQEHDDEPKQSKAGARAKHG